MEKVSYTKIDGIGNFSYSGVRLICQISGNVVRFVYKSVAFLMPVFICRLVSSCNKIAPQTPSKM